MENFSMWQKSSEFMLRFYHIMTVVFANVFILNLLWCRSNGQLGRGCILCHFSFYFCYSVMTIWCYWIILCLSVQNLSILTGQSLHLFASVASSLNYWYGIKVSPDRFYFYHYKCSCLFSHSLCRGLAVDLKFSH